MTEEDEIMSTLQVIRLVIFGNPNVVEAEADMYVDAINKAIGWISYRKPVKATGEYPFCCPRCGKKLVPSKFCGECGQRVEFDKRQK